MSMSRRLMPLFLGFWSAAQAGTILLSPVPAEKLKLAAREAAAAVGQPRFLCNPSAYVAGDPASGADAKACGKQRQIAGAPQEIAVVYWVPLQAAACPSKPGVAVEFVEVPRRTVLGQQIKTLVDALRDKLGVEKADTDAKALATGGKKEPPPWRWCEYELKYTLQHLRATLTLNARLPDEADKPIQDTATLITGPEENWFLSGDGILRGADQVKWDADKKTLVSADKPEQLYIGINYMLGDIYAEQRFWDFRKRIVLKAMLLPSRRPFDSAGLGIGYRFRDGGFLDDKADTGGMVLFVGHFWTKGDAAGSSEAVPRERSWRVGVSYSLDNLLDWIK